MPFQPDFLEETSQVQTDGLSKNGLPEQAGYFTVPGAHLYTVLHPVTDPIARVLLVGPFAIERHFSYHPWVRWARYLAARQIEVLRYDYRGVGESTGVFEEMSFEHWSEDVQLLADWLASRSPAIPLLLYGLELGAILAGRCFHAGSGDALLLSSPLANANQVLRSNLLRWTALEQMDESPENRKSASAFIRQLEHGTPIEIQGYRWSSQLWKDSFHCDMPSTLIAANESSYSETYKRPVRIVKFSKDSAPLIGPYLRYDVVQDFKWLFAENFKFVASALALPTGEGNAA